MLTKINANRACRPASSSLLRGAKSGHLVEQPATEVINGVGPVKQQIRIAASRTPLAGRVNPSISGEDRAKSLGRGYDGWLDALSRRMPGDPMIDVVRLTKSFGPLAVLRGLTFRVGRGEFVVVLGPSGAGKSTLLRCLNGLVRPSGGSVSVDGIGLDRGHLAAVRKRVGFIFQGVNVHGNLSVLQNVLMGRLAGKSRWGILFSEEDRRVARAAIERVGLAAKGDDRVSTLSGGQRQRVGIARALAHDPAVLLADEPVSSLDPVTGREILDLLREINRDRGTTVLCNLHDVGLATRVADRILGLRDGAIAFDGPPGRLTPADLARIHGDRRPQPEPSEVAP